MERAISKMNQTMDMLFFDGKCPLCQSEIKKLAIHTQGKLVLQDLHDLTEGSGYPPKSVLMSRLHLLDAQGHWHTGLDANIRAWHHTPYRYLWAALNWPLVRWFSHFAYELWLQWRSRRACSLNGLGAK